MRFSPGPLLTALSILGTTGCSSIGPATIPRDQFDYGDALSTSAREQLLLNIVRIRYMEAPVFLDVVSVINQYGLEGEISLAAGWGTSMLDSARDTQQIGGVGRWSDRPTITYSPVSGQQFSRSMMTPLTPEALFALVQSGWPADVVFGVTLRSINGMNNDVPTPVGRKSADPRFFELIDLWGRLRDAGAMGLRLEEGDDEKHVVMFYQGQEFGEDVQRDVQRVRELLGMTSDATEVRLTYGLVPDEPNEIAVLSRSIMDIMISQAWYLDVPPEHVEEGRTGPTFVPKERGAGRAITNGYGTKRPDTALTAIRNRDYWFYVDDRDMASKRTFAFMEIMLSLADTGALARGPVVSLVN